MNVNQLRERLEELEAAGHGQAPVRIALEGKGPDGVGWETLGDLARVEDLEEPDEEEPATVILEGEGESAGLDLGILPGMT